MAVPCGEGDLLTAGHFVLSRFIKIGILKLRYLITQGNNVFVGLLEKKKCLAQGIMGFPGGSVG